MHESPSDPPAEDEDPLAFTPVPTAPRHNGWTPERQRRFILALSAMGAVRPAAQAVGMSKQTAYELRKRPGAESFARAWDIALQMGQDEAFAIMMDKAMHGVLVPRYFRGRLIGIEQRWDSKLLLAALREPPAPRSPGQS